MTVLFTKTMGVDFVAEVRGEGFDVDCVDFIENRALCFSFSAEMLGAKGALVFTSAFGVDVFLRLGLLCLKGWFFFV